MRNEKRYLVLAALIGLALCGTARAVDPAATAITIPEMECKGCAAKVTTALTGIAGVAAVQTDVKNHITVVKPKPQMVLSPRALWEALEKIDKTPSKLEGPSGTFTSKPQS